MTPTHALYLYAVVPEACRLDAVVGIADATVDVVTGAGAGLVVSDVRIALLAEVNAATDGKCLAELALRHDGVVREVSAAAKAVLPFRLGTLLPDRDSAHRYLAARTELLGPALTRVESCFEWGVTVHGGQVEDRAPPPEPETHTGAGAGTAYLLRRRQELARTQETQRARAQAGAEVADVLRTKATGVVAGRPRGDDVLFCQNYLVQREAEAAFLEAVDSVQGSPIRLQPRAADQRTVAALLVRPGPSPRGGSWVTRRSRHGAWRRAGSSISSIGCSPAASSSRAMS